MGICINEFEDFGLNHKVVAKDIVDGVEGFKFFAERKIQKKNFVEKFVCFQYVIQDACRQFKDIVRMHHPFNEACSDGV